MLIRRCIRLQTVAHFTAVQSSRLSGRADAHTEIRLELDYVVALPQ